LDKETDCWFRECIGSAVPKALDNLGYTSLKEYVADHPRKDHKRGGPALASGQPVPVSGVYFVQSGDDGPIKIGFSTNIRMRIDNLSVGSPDPLHLLAAIRGGRAEERKMHRMFKDARLHGEWFEPVPELLETISGMAP